MAEDEQASERKTQRLGKALRRLADSYDRRNSLIELGGTAVGSILLGIGSGIVSGHPPWGVALLLVGAIFVLVSLAFIVMRPKGAMELAADAMAARAEADGLRLRLEADRLRLTASKAAADAETKKLLEEAADLSRKRNLCLTLHLSLLELVERFLLRPEDQRRLDHAFTTLMTLIKGKHLAAFGFEPSVRWTISIFQRREGGNGEEVLWRTHVLRFNGDPNPTGRTWLRGEGYSGYVWDTGSLLVLPNTSAVEGLPNIVRAPEKQKQDDADLYRSVAAVPISLGTNREIWGVAVATSDQVGQFDNVRTEALAQLHAESVRSLSRYISVLVVGATA